ncbi:hypothetical protein ACFXPA_03900 [Amycolatopsis sp. NPDC059090]|uniref:hypothetical protein n=1 Tax=unclassified Amycolatopsis TaxID=2618356 RepID=UPI003671280A
MNAAEMDLFGRISRGWAMGERSGAGRAEGAESGPANENAPAEPEPGYEIPIGMPVPAAEMERLKAAARRHRDREEADAPARAGDEAAEEEGDHRDA